MWPNDDDGKCIYLAGAQAERNADVRGRQFNGSCHHRPHSQFQVTSKTILG